ncbi:hypothetical protein SEA_GLASS_63 [Mycobacterium phage Glass]|uniref:Uncharacterized protein n=1 Tax=Mycobacterium phage Glass TaxID=1784939 RepID=A0A0Y0AG13_9CAUD|nr:hypothetical protein SEA_GLASS_63 [Mycobacterium phage Glass]QYC54306.1 hypothetical protein SEA_ALLEGRO_62 [Mycobacterium phage Allegro]
MRTGVREPGYRQRSISQVLSRARVRAYVCAREDGVLWATPMAMVSPYRGATSRREGQTVSTVFAGQETIPPVRRIVGNHGNEEERAPGADDPG